MSDWVFKTRERNVLREMLPMPDYRGGTTLVFDRMMRRIENEAFEKKRLEKQCNRNLKESESEKTVIEIRLRNKTKELNSINANRHANREDVYVLKKEKALLERKLEVEVMNSNRLRRQVDDLKATIRGLAQNIDHIQSEHSKEVRNTYRRLYSDLCREV